jgi:hypothetical protein
LDLEVQLFHLERQVRLLKLGVEVGEVLEVTLVLELEREALMHHPL